MSYSAPERETIIRCDDETKLWSIFTLQQTIITKLTKVGAKPYKVDSDGGHWYKDLKFNQISFRSGKELSEEQRKERSERMRKQHKNKKGDNV